MRDRPASSSSRARGFRLGSPASRIGLLVVVALVTAAVLPFMPRIPQPLAYHNLADQRTLLGIPHALNVVSNLPFFFVGVAACASSGASCRTRPVFLLGALFGKLMDDRGSTATIARVMATQLGQQRAMLAVVLAGGCSPTAGSACSPRSSCWRRWLRPCFRRRESRTA